MKKVLALCLALCMMLFGVAGFAEGASYTPGTYTAEARGMWGTIPVTVTVSENAIESIEVGENNETVGLRQWPMNIIPQELSASQTLAVDTVTGATVTSRGIISAVEDCLKQASASRIRPSSSPSRPGKAATRSPIRNSSTKCASTRSTA